jgi:hypothetical protein
MSCHRPLHPHHNHHHTQAIAAHLSTVITLLPLLPTRLQPSAAFALLTGNGKGEGGEDTTSPCPFRLLPQEAFTSQHTTALLDLFLPSPEPKPNRNSSSSRRGHHRSCSCPHQRRARLPALCLARGCHGETDARLRARTLADRVLFLPSLRAALGRSPAEYARVVGLVRNQLLLQLLPPSPLSSPPALRDPVSQEEREEEEEEEGEAEAGAFVTTTVLFHAVPGMGLVPASVETTGPASLMAALARQGQRRVRDAVALRALRLALGLPAPVVAWHLPSLLKAVASACLGRYQHPGSGSANDGVAGPLLDALVAALSTLGPTKLSAHAPTLLQVLVATVHHAATGEQQHQHLHQHHQHQHHHQRRLASILRRQGLGRLAPCTLSQLAAEVEGELQRYGSVYVGLRYRPAAGHPSSPSPSASTAGAGAGAGAEEGTRRQPVRVAGFWGERRRLLLALERCALLAVPSPSLTLVQQQGQRLEMEAEPSIAAASRPFLIDPLLALLRHQWGLGPTQWDHGLLLAGLRALAAHAGRGHGVAEGLKPCMGMLLGWATGQAPAEAFKLPAATAAAAAGMATAAIAAAAGAAVVVIPESEEGEGEREDKAVMTTVTRFHVPEGVRLAALAVLRHLAPLSMAKGCCEEKEEEEWEKDPRIGPLLAVALPPESGEEGEEEEEEDDGSVRSGSSSSSRDNSGGNSGDHLRHLPLRVAAALALPLHAMLGLSRLQPLIAACLAAPFEEHPFLHRAALRLLLRLSPHATLPHVPILSRQHLYDNEEGWEEEDEGSVAVSSMAAALLNRLPTHALNATIRSVMQHLLKGAAPTLSPPRAATRPPTTSTTTSQRSRRRKHPLEALALLDHALVHARGEAFLFHRLLPPAGIERQRQFCQARCITVLCCIALCFWFWG